MSEDFTQTSFKPLAMGAILKEALTQVWERRRHFGLWLVIPTVVTAVVFYFQDKWLGEKPELSVSLFAKAIALGIPFVLVFTVFAVACHRSILLGEDAVLPLGFLKWTKRESRFFAWSVFIWTASIIGLFIGLILLLPFVMLAGIFALPWLRVVPDSLAEVLGLLCAIIPAAYVVGRLSLLLPATAVNQQPTVKWAWSESEKHAMRLAFLVGFIPMFITVTIPIFDWSTSLLGHVFGSVLRGLIYYCLATVEIVILSISFREITGFRHASQPF